MEQHLTPKGTRDISPEVFAKRQFIVDTIKRVFQQYGYQQMETPAMETLTTLTGKYGGEGEQLIFHVLNSGDYLRKVETSMLERRDSKALTPHIAQKGLRYDLTVPFARYVAAHRHAIAFPFKRFQIQPVWRADRPQKGRYREFYQCDADVIGTQSLLCEAEMIAIIRGICDMLRIQHYRIRVNHRAILSELAKIARVENQESFFSVLDKWHKIGEERVAEELLNQGMSPAMRAQIMAIFHLKGSNAEKINLLSAKLESTKGLDDIEKITDFLAKFGMPEDAFQLDMTLARGLNYYTGTLFEVTIDDVAIGSVCGGGRYDHLTDYFGLPNVSGVGISFGIDRLYDAMEALNLFPRCAKTTTTVCIASLDETSMQRSIAIASTLRTHGCQAMVYPDCHKLKKQLDYAHKNGIPFVIIVGEDEVQSGQFTLKNMRTGSQGKHSLEDMIPLLQKT